MLSVECGFEKAEGTTTQSGSAETTPMLWTRDGGRSLALAGGTRVAVDSRALEAEEDGTLVVVVGGAAGSWRTSGTETSSIGMDSCWREFLD